MTLMTCGLAWVRGADEPIDMQKARALHERVLKGEKLTDEEKAYHDRAAQEIQRRGGQGQGKAQPKGLSGPVPTPTSSTGLIPLTDLGSQTYKGEDGGLYGGGSNEPPAEHRAAVERQVKQIRPLDAAGRPAADGKIVFISIGMSNTTQEFSAFKKKADADPKKSPAVLLVDGAQGGRVASVWANDDNGGGRGPDPWPVLDQRLKDAGVSPAQVQVAWIKHAQAGPQDVRDFPRMMHAQTLAANIILTLERLRRRFPNLRVAYLSSRIYAGYATTPLNPEPYAYEGAFANRWVIQSQIKGDPLLNFDPDKGTVMAPAVLWGPYLWADGVKPRQGDGLVWLREDLSPGDGTHPSDSGREKVANLLLDFVQHNPLASPWYLGQGGQSAP
jgi:hypothetical protein